MYISHAGHLYYVMSGCDVIALVTGLELRLDFLVAQFRVR